MAEEQLGGFVWSSEEYNVDDAWFVFMNGGYAGSRDKSRNSYVRAVSAF